ncbi:hypothetical protein [Candidatus Sulfurimonas baltica]|uniref:Uncharacterized protein n=1 Tax=Candidatus Sulfurimonas baltica TaxID=2740404 RepID=A0A7S7LXK0_9BACT|nr:hypothetical protein [Candidatus Sulfurimonas baltica]QOY53211.1 hypothetical protein HUE88_05900 [Candidatus Sulfurimonas baltica]
MENSDILIKGFKLDYVDPEHKIINRIDQIDIFALFNDNWVVIKKVAIEEGVVYLIKKDGTGVSFEQNNPINSEILKALEQVSQAFKDHFKK